MFVFEFIEDQKKTGFHLKLERILCLVCTEKRQPNQIFAVN